MPDVTDKRRPESTAIRFEVADETRATDASASEIDSIVQDLTADFAKCLKDHDARIGAVHAGHVASLNECHREEIADLHAAYRDLIREMHDESEARFDRALAVSEAATALNDKMLARHERLQAELHGAVSTGRAVAEQVASEGDALLLQLKADHRRIRAERDEMKSAKERQSGQGCAKRPSGELLAWVGRTAPDKLALTAGKFIVYLESVAGKITTPKIKRITVDPDNKRTPVVFILREENERVAWRSGSLARALNRAAPSGQRRRPRAAT